MEAWLILLGVMLPLAPALAALDRRLGSAEVREPDSRVAPRPRRDAM